MSPVRRVRGRPRRRGSGSRGRRRLRALALLGALAFVAVAFALACHMVLRETSAWRQGWEPDGRAAQTWALSDETRPGEGLPLTSGGETTSATSGAAEALALTQGAQGPTEVPAGANGEIGVGEPFDDGQALLDDVAAREVRLSAGDLRQVATQETERYRNQQGAQLVHAGYLDLTGNVWGCVVTSQEWTELCFVSDAGDGACRVSVVRMEAQAWEEAYGRDLS